MAMRVSVCAGVCRCVQVCAGVYRCVCRCVQVCAGVLVCVGVYGCPWCVDDRGCVRVTQQELPTPAGPKPNPHHPGRTR